MTHELGWTYCSHDKIYHNGFAILDRESNPNDELRHLAIVYPQRIAASDPDIRYGDKSFALTYQPVPTEAPTAVFVPPWLADVRVMVNGEPVAFDASSHHVVHRHAAREERQTIQISWR